MEKLNRLQSGIEGLDALLKGGLVSGASYIVQGRPGSGKTILANQLGFHHARNGGRVLVAFLALRRLLLRPLRLRLTLAAARAGILIRRVLVT